MIFAENTRLDFEKIGGESFFAGVSYRGFWRLRLSDRFFIRVPLETLTGGNYSYDCTERWTGYLSILVLSG